MNADATRLSGASGRGLSLAEDLMTGAEAIAVFMFGDASETNKRKVYHASDKLGLPTFKLGGTICARRSTIIAWIEERERAI
ncbi:DNA-binding protein [Methylobacterium nigriterrae]|uniref:DNA-binding protein n=1 Tax=Methylobacterium nigriterrae TaxID=3127512 RepID=UPI0030141199